MRENFVVMVFYILDCRHISDVSLTCIVRGGNIAFLPNALNIVISIVRYSSRQIR